MSRDTRDIREGSHAETLDIENFVSDSERAWLAWAKQVETRLGHSLDGNQDRDGYSLDYAHDAWKRGESVQLYFLSVLVEINARRIIAEDREKGRAI